jgi:regulatory protein
MPAEALSAEDVQEADLAIDCAVRALARCDHSVAGLRAKLERAGFSESAQADALDTLGRRGYLDDARYARHRAAVLAERGYGDERICAELAAQGVDREAVESALAALQPEADRALREAAKAGGGVRAIQALARRGFAEEALEGLGAGVVADDPSEGVG